MPPAHRTGLWIFVGLIYSRVGSTFYYDLYQLGNSGARPTTLLYAGGVSTVDGASVVEVVVAVTV